MIKVDTKPGATLGSTEHDLAWVGRAKHLGRLQTNGLSLKRG